MMKVALLVVALCAALVPYTLATDHRFSPETFSIDALPSSYVLGSLDMIHCSPGICCPRGSICCWNFTKFSCCGKSHGKWRRSGPTLPC